MGAFIELRVDVSSRVDPAEMQAAGLRLIPHVRAVVGREGSAAVWPVGSEAGFTWPGGFGPRSRDEGLEVVRQQLIDPRYRGEEGVFPLVTFGEWESEVVHPEPPDSYRAVEVHLYGPSPGRSVVGPAGLSETGEGQWSGVVDDVWISVSDASGPLPVRLNALGGAVSREWAALVASDVDDVGTRLYCEPQIMSATGAKSILDLFWIVAGAAEGLGASPLAGSVVTLEASLAGSVPLEGGAVLGFLDVPENRYRGSIIVEAPPVRRAGRRFQSAASGSSILIGASVERHTRGELRVEVFESGDASHEPWRWVRTRLHDSE